LASFNGWCMMCLCGKVGADGTRTGCESGRARRHHPDDKAKHAFAKAVGKFGQALATVPDYPAATFSDEPIQFAKLNKAGNETGRR